MSEVIVSYVGCESYYGDTESREKIAEPVHSVSSGPNGLEISGVVHGGIGEDGRLVRIVNKLRLKEGE